MKIAILGDVHFGARNSNQTIEYWQRRFYEEVFWPYIDENNITTILQTGDYFDNRKWINLQTMAFQKNVFVKEVQKRNIDCHVIIGNHDIPLRHSLKNSSVEQILGEEKNFTVYTKPTKVDFHGKEITMVPWICKQNEEECIEVIRQGGDTIFGHFEITGFMMHPGAISKEGITPVDFKGWNTVWSGHYHAQSERENIHYLGTPYQMTWNDHSTKHGFWVFDTTDESMTFVNNPLSFFHKVIWEDGTDFEPEKVKDSYVKIEVKQKTDFESFEKFLDKINFNQPYNIKVIESFEEYNSNNVSDMIQLASTTDLIQEYISDVATVNNKENIIATMLDIYNEAVELSDQV